MHKWLDEEWESKLIQYSDEKYAMQQLDQLRDDLRSEIGQIERTLRNLSEGVDQVKCGLTRGHSWRLASFDDRTYPMREPPGVYKYKCVHCGETIMLQADKKKDWEPFIKLATE